jgi:hypothetical protein
MSGLWQCIMSCGAAGVCCVLLLLMVMAAGEAM